MIAPAGPCRWDCESRPVVRRCTMCQRTYWRDRKRAKSKARPSTARKALDTAALRRSLRPALDAYLAVWRHHTSNEGRDPTPYSGPIAWDVLNVLAPDSSDRHEPEYRRWRQMADQVIEMARREA